MKFDMLVGITIETVASSQPSGPLPNPLLGLAYWSDNQPIFLVVMIGRNGFNTDTDTSPEESKLSLLISGFALTGTSFPTRSSVSCPSIRIRAGTVLRE